MTNSQEQNDNTRSFVPIIKGTMISHYRIIEKIGAGGMGEVYLAEDTKLDRKVALKFLPLHLCPDEDYHARFKREAQAVAKLNHPNMINFPNCEVPDA
jgi:serine/threonine protein kinase